MEETNRGVLALYSELSEELEETNRGVVALYAELDEKSRQLREASEAKSRFWANVSHELRTPVNAVVGLAELLRADADAPAEERAHRLSLIADSGRTLLALVDELLDVAKAESGTLDPQWAPLDLRAVLAHLDGTLRGLARPGVALRIDPAPAGPGTLLGDETMLVRILRNLLSNALKFTERGSVELATRVEDGPDGGPVLVLTVTDTGIGIPADQQERVFEEFYQVRGPHQRGRRGTGLGLPYARRLTEILGGTLRLDSEPGRGTAITVRLPAHPAPPADTRWPCWSRSTTTRCSGACCARCWTRSPTGWWRPTTAPPRSPPSATPDRTGSSSTCTWARSTATRCSPTCGPTRSCGRSRWSSSPPPR